MKRGHFTAKLALGWLSCYIYMCLTCTSKKSPRKYSMVCFLVDTIVFSFPCQNPPFFASIWQQHWWSMDNFGFDNSVDNWQDKYFHCSLHYTCATGFIKQRTLIVLYIQYSWTEFLYTIFSWTCIIRPNTLQFHMAAMQGSSHLSSKANYFWLMGDCYRQVPLYHG